jgi:hypothetical protein
VRTLLVPPGGDDGLAQRLHEFAAASRVIALGERRPGAQLVWPRARPDPTFLQRHPVLRAAVGRAAMVLYRAYFDRRAFRRLLDGTRATQRLMQGGADYNPLFRVPPANERAALLETLGDLPVPRVRSEKPVAIEWWRQHGVEQLHLVNYADAPQEVIVTLPWTVRARALSPDTDDALTLEGRSLRATLDVYTVFLFQRQDPDFSRKPGFVGSCEGLD